SIAPSGAPAPRSRRASRPPWPPPGPGAPAVRPAHSRPPPSYARSAFGRHAYPMQVGEPMSPTAPAPLSSPSSSDAAPIAPVPGPATGLASDALHRALRGLASVGVFTLAKDGRFANNRSSQALQSNRLTHLREFAIYFGSASNLRAWRDCENAIRTGKSAFPR